jgi:hypothetical protein
MKNKKRESRLTTHDWMGSTLGIDLYEDTKIERMVVIPVHFTAVQKPFFEINDGGADFPLADLDRPHAPNTTVTIVFLRLHPGEPITGAYQFRYHHRDSVDELDLKRRYRFSLAPEDDPDTVIADLIGFLPIVGEPAILDLSDLDVTEAMETFAAMPFNIVRPRIS